MKPHPETMVNVLRLDGTTVLGAVVEKVHESSVRISFWLNHKEVFETLPFDRVLGYATWPPTPIKAEEPWSLT